MDWCFNGGLLKPFSRALKSRSPAGWPCAHVLPVTVSARPVAAPGPRSVVTVVLNYLSFFPGTLCCVACCNLLNGFIPIFTHNILDLLTVRNTTLPVAVPLLKEFKIGKINQGQASRNPLFSLREGGEKNLPSCLLTRTLVFRFHHFTIHLDH